MKSLRIAALLMLALFAGRDAVAQTYPLGLPSEIPWNTYVPSRIPDGFASIIGNGGTLISGSNTANLYDNIYSVTLPFNFLFLNTTYAQGYTLRVGTAGYVSFNGSTYTGQTYAYYGYQFAQAYGGNYYPYYNKVILAHATATNNVGASDGGVYYAMTGTAPNRVLTIEWRTQLYFYTAEVGNFQIKLFEATGNIDWFFGPSNMTQVITPGYVFGAWTGIKNLGDPYNYYSATNPATNETVRPNDQDRSMLFTDPDRLPGVVAVTGLHLYTYDNVYYYSLFYPINAALTHPEYMHDGFPNFGGQRIGFRASPVINDVSADSIWLTPRVTANAYGVGATPAANVRFRNAGAATRQNVPVQADLYFNGVRIDTRTSTAFTAATPQFGTNNVTFGAFGPLGNTGIYEIRAYAMFTGDQDAFNDTVKTTFYISKPNDLMPYDILQPFANAAPLFTKYPLGVAVPIEVRYLNIGTNPQFNATVGYRIYNAAGTLMNEATTTIAGRWDPISFKDVLFTPWTPTVVGRYFIQAFTALPGDEQPNNDIFPTTGPGKAFDVLYEIETSAGTPGVHPSSPTPNQTLPDGKPAVVFTTFFNNGVSDVTNVPARLQIRNAAGTIVYDRTIIISDIVSDGGQAIGRFPDFTPNGSGRYCATAFINYSSDPVRGNDTTSWCFNVAPRLNGTINIGFGERFRTINEAVDSMFYYGIGSPVTFQLVDDSYTVTTTEATVPALDFRGRVVGLSSANPVLFRPIAGKTDVAVTLRSASGIGMWFGQRDTSNSNGYITFDGGQNKALRFIYENTNTATATSAYNRAIPFYFGQGASNYTVKNVKIQPITGTTAVYRPNALSLPLPAFAQSNQQFTFTPDVSTTTSSITVSAGVMLRNSAPIDVVSGRNVRNADTIRNTGIRIENNEIRGFGYGIVSVGIGPLFNVGTGRFAEYANQNNVFTGNLMENLGRAGVAVVYEKGAEISDNTIRRVSNATTTPHAVGIWSTAGGNATNNRGFSTDLRIERNKLSQISTSNGTGAGVWIESSENVLNTPSNVVTRYPTAGATNMRVWNNFLSAYSGPQTIGIGLTMEAATRGDLVVTGNRVENNTLYSTASTSPSAEKGTQVQNHSTESGVYIQRAGVSVQNNIFALVSPVTNPVAVVYITPTATQNIVSDYNLFYVPNGYVGQLTNLSSQGFSLPSGPRLRTLNQWRAYTGLDRNSVEGNIVPEFVSTTPGAEDLHIRTQTVGSLVGNRGTAVGGLTNDIDRESRGGAPVRGFYDIGADEFVGVIRNNDLAAEDVMGPSGFRAATGQFSDAEYVMSDSMVPLRARLRNLGGMPITQNAVTMTVSFINPSNGQLTQVRRTTQNAAADVASTRDVDFGAFMPQTLRELGFSDAFYGNNPNVTPIYRFNITSGTDDNAANNSYSKDVRFYVQRSTREVLVAVEHYMAAGTDPVTLSNRLNSDSLVAALRNINWERADGAGLEDFDLFEREKWPSENLDFRAWDLLIWEQGSEAEGLRPEERNAIRQMLSMGNAFNRRNLILAGEDVAQIHDVALTASNGATADQDFVRNVLRAQYMRATVPADYTNRRIRGVTITPGKFEELERTAVAGDAPPMPAVVRATPGQGIATLSHAYVDQTVQGDSGAGVAAAGSVYNSVYYAFDWRHAGRFNFELAQSGGRRLLLGALDFIDQYGGVLPINLVSFGAYQAGERVNVEWETARETEISALEVERAEVTKSETGESVGSFSVIDRVAPKGTATSGARYASSDRNVTVGRVYIYRLVSVNLEGVRTSEETARVAITGGTVGGYDLSVLPNPVRESGSVAYRAPRGERVTLELYNVEGSRVATLASEEPSTGEGVIAVDVSGLASGSYSVRLRSTSGVTTTTTLTVVK